MNDPIEFRDSMRIELLHHHGSDEDIARAAWVSTKGAQSIEERTPEKMVGLIRALLRGKHGTPFEHASMTFFVEAPIFVFREWHRHRIGFSYNEMSGRYLKKMPGNFWVPPLGRNLVKEGKGMTPKFVPGTTEQVEMVQDHMRQAYNGVWATYEGLIDAGIANEVARAILPVGLYSAMHVTMNPRSLMAFLALRTGRDDAQHRSYPQREIEECAEKLEAEFARLFPITHMAFNEFKRVAP